MSKAKKQKTVSTSSPVIEDDSQSQTETHDNCQVRAFDNTWTSFGWDFEFPCKDGYYRLDPLSSKNFIPTPGNTIFEGLCRILDKNGEQVGWAAMETMDVKVMHNAPNEEFNHFPSK